MELNRNRAQNACENQTGRKKRVIKQYNKGPDDVCVEHGFDIGGTFVDDFEVSGGACGDKISAAERRAQQVRLENVQRLSAIHAQMRDGPRIRLITSLEAGEFAHYGVLVVSQQPVYENPRSPLSPTTASYTTSGDYQGAG